MTENKEYRSFHGKILLFGEYSVLEGSMALVMPYLKVKGRLCIPEKGKISQMTKESHLKLVAFADYLVKKFKSNTGGIPVLLDEFLEDMDNEVYFDSDIPESSGLGSSGALCAAIYDGYAKDKIEPSFSPKSGNFIKLKEIFSAMENYFHGQSSGTDPLCIYTGLPLLLKDKNNIQPVNLTIKNINCFMLSLDPCIPGHTAKLVSYFKTRMADNRFAMSFRNHYIPLVNSIVDHLVVNDISRENIMKLSEYQFINFKRMIPSQLLPLWKFGLDSGLFSCKLCGSGGGGIILGFTAYFDRTKEVIKNQYGISIDRIYY